MLRIESGSESVDPISCLVQSKSALRQSLNGAIGGIAADLVTAPCDQEVVERFFKDGVQHQAKSSRSPRPLARLV